MTLRILPMFPKQSRYLISVFLPTRGRPESLKKAIKSIEVNTANLGLIEIIFRIDDDDIETINAVNAIRSHCRIPMKAIIGPRGRGYGDIHKHVDNMAAVAEGDWLLFFNDDAELKTKNWDKELLGLVLPSIWHYCPEDTIAITAKTNGVLESNEFIFVRRRIYQILGRISPTPYADSWLYQVLTPIQGIVRLGNIEVEHYRDVQDRTRKDTTNFSLEGFATLEGITPIMGQLSDTLRLLNHMQVRLESAEILDSPKEPGWYYWQQKHNGKPYHIFVDEDKEMWPAKVDGGVWRLRLAAPQFDK